MIRHTWYKYSRVSPGCYRCYRYKKTSDTVVPRLQQVHSLTTMQLHVCNRSAVLLPQVDFRFQALPNCCCCEFYMSNLLKGTYSTEPASRNTKTYVVALPGHQIRHLLRHVFKRALMFSKNAFANLSRQVCTLGRHAASAHHHGCSSALSSR